MTGSLPTTPEATVALTQRLNSWLDRAGAPSSGLRADLVVGLADTLAAAHLAAEALERMLATDPSTAAGSDAALAETGIMHAWLDGEMKHHLAELLAAWESILETPLLAQLPPDEDEVS